MRDFQYAENLFFLLALGIQVEPLLHNFPLHSAREQETFLRFSFVLKVMLHLTSCLPGGASELGRKHHFVTSQRASHANLHT